jgi:hypothetical protein
LPILSGGRFWYPAFIVVVIGYYLAFAVYPGLFDVIGLGHSRGWFLDSYAILASNDALAAGRDAYSYNPLDPLGRPHVYSHWWLNLSALGFTRGNNFVLGSFFVGAFFTAVLGWLRPRSAGEAIWYFCVITAGSIVLGVERANNDLLMLALLMPVVPMLRSDREWVRWGALIPVVVATALKFYPAVGALVLLAGVSRREVIGRGLTVAVLLVLVALDVRGDMERIAPFLPDPQGLVTLGAEQVFIYFGLGKPAAVLCGVVTGLVAMIAVRPWRWFEGWAVAERDREKWLVFVLGAALLTGCFFAGSSYGYRLIYCLFLAPFLWRMMGDTEAPVILRRLARVTGGLMIFVLWADSLASAVLSNRMTPANAEHLLKLADGFAIAGEPLVWAFFGCLLCFLAGFGREVWRVLFPRQAGR